MEGCGHASKQPGAVAAQTVPSHLAQLQGLCATPAGRPRRALLQQLLELPELVESEEMEFHQSGTALETVYKTERPLFDMRITADGAQSHHGQVAQRRGRWSKPCESTCHSASEMQHSSGLLAPVRATVIAQLAQLSTSLQLTVVGFRSQ